MIYVVNKRNHKSTLYDIPCHRGYILGNPASHKSSDFDVVVCKTRAEAIDYYFKWFHLQIEQKNQKVLAELRKIYRMAKAGDVYLVCYCAPLDCHCNIIKEFIESKL